MAKKQMKPEEGSMKEKINEFRGRVGDFVSKGYTCLGTSIPQVSEITQPSQEDMRSAMAGAGCEMPGGKTAHRSFGMFDSKQSNPIPVSGVGTDGYGYIQWGPKNDLPNQIFSLGSSLPYTSAALKFLIDLTVGKGPALMYKWARYAGGTVSEELIPFEHAGVLIRNRIRELETQLRERDKNEDREEGGGDGGQTATFHQPKEGTVLLWDDAINPTPEVPKENPEDEPGTLEFELKTLKEDYIIWKNTQEAVEEFLEDNNLSLHFLKCITDYVHMDMYIPTVGFSVGRAGEWSPKIVSIGHIPDVCARLEQMDENLRVNYVYYSERWRQDATAELKAKDIVAYPAVMNETMLNGWKGLVRKHQRTRVKDRPTWVACPIRYPSMQNPYYPRPAWWSIFPSLVYNYASTLVVDKAIARQNGTMWSKIIFINQEYLQSIFDLRNADTPEKQEAIRNEIYNRVNNLLQRKENNGKTLLMDMFPGPDGKTMQYSIEIEDVPQPASGAETKDELEEISSIIFFAFGINPSLVGAVPGKSGSSGGTYQRELTLLKQNLLNPCRALYLKFLQNIHSFNRWDKHGVWKINDLVLTTLDRSKTGTEEVSS